MPLDDVKAYARVTGSATLAAFGNGRPATAESYVAGSFCSFEGRWLAIVRAGYEVGEAILTVSAEKFGEMKITLPIDALGTGVEAR